MSDPCRLSDRAVSCFTHGLSHLLAELGPEAGLREGMRILEGMNADDVAGLLGGRIDDMPNDRATADTHLPVSAS